MNQRADEVSKRAVLRSAGALGVVGLSGCVLFDTTDGGRSYDFSLNPVASNDIADAVALGPDDYRAGQRGLVERAVESEKAKTYGHEPIEDGAYVAFDGTYYRVHVTETGEKELPRTVLRGELVDSAEAGDQAVELTAYSGEDVRAVKYAVATADRKTGDEKSNAYVFHGRSAADSALLPEPKYEFVKHDDQYVRLVVERRRVTETEYTYTLERVATSKSAFRDHVAAQEVTATYRSAELSEEQTEMLRKAIEDVYSEFEPISDGYRAILERFGENAELPELGEFADTYVEYDGQYHEASVSISVP